MNSVIISNEHTETIEMIQLDDEWISQTLLYKITGSNKLVQTVHSWVWGKTWISFTVRLCHIYITSLGFISIFVPIPFPLFIISCISSVVYLMIRISLYHVGQMKLLLTNIEYLFHIALICVWLISAFFIVDLYSSLIMSFTGLFAVIVILNSDSTIIDIRVFIFSGLLTLISLVVVLICLFFGLDRLDDRNIIVFGKILNLRLFFIDKFVLFTLLFARMFRAKVKDKNSNLFLYNRNNYGYR